MKKIVCALLLLTLLSGCSAFSAPQSFAQTNTPVPSITSVPEGPNLDLFKNYAFNSPSLQTKVQLSNGKYESGSGETYENLQLLDQAGFGDLNGDGNADAAVLLAENSGGSGVFVYLVALVKQADGYSQSAPMLIDDRPQIDSVTIQNNTIHLEGKIHGAADSMADPTMKISEDVQLMHSRLVVSKLDSTIGGADRSITIDSPAENDEVSDSFSVKGSMPIGPFENNLTYRFYDSAGNLLIEQPFAVQSDGTGGAATFNGTVNLPKSTNGASLLFVLADQSMANGSDLCLNSVNLIVK